MKFAAEMQKLQDGPSMVHGHAACKERPIDACRPLEDQHRAVAQSRSDPALCV